MKAQKSHDLLAFVEKLLDLFERSREIRDYKDRVSDTHRFPLTYFERIEPLLGDPMRPDGWVCFSDVKPTDLTPVDWDVSVLTFSENDEQEEGDKEHYNLVRHRRIKPREMRGHKMYSEMINESAVAIVYPDGRYMTAKTHSFYIRGKWVGEDFGYAERRIGEERYAEPSKLGLHWSRENDPKASLGIEFNRYYEWKVDIQRLGGMELSFTTDPIGAQEVFRLRDLPEGASRRAALRNWVMEHWRKSRDCDVKVRRHLRGAVEFVWNDLKCVIRPSPDDLRLNEKYKLEREVERLRQEVNRRKAAAV